MINFTVLKSSADMKRYYAPTGHDYWIDDKDQVAFFGGKLAERFGLKEFDLQAFHDLCDGILPGSRRIDPETGEVKTTPLTPGRRPDSRAGWDVTVDGPKDLGVLMALGMDDRIIPEVLERAGRDVMAMIERDAKTRVRVSGQDTDRETGQIVYTGVLHTTARPVGDKIDVQPHFHFLVANVTYDPVEKKLKALQLQPYAQNGAREARPFYTAYFNNQLARYMQELGYQIEPDRRTGSFRVVGVSEAVRKEFSQRTQKIEAVASQLEKQKQEFLGDPSARLNAEVKGRLGAHTREPKKPGKTWNSLMQHWLSRVTDSELTGIEETVEKSRRRPRQVEKVLDRSKEAVDWSLRHLLERSSVVSQRDVVTQALRHGLGSVTPEGVLKEIGSRKDLIRRVVEGQEMVTTQAVLDEENSILAFAKKGRDRWRSLGHLDDKNVVNMHQPIEQAGIDTLQSSRSGIKGANSTQGGSNLPEREYQLSPTQQAAVNHAWKSHDRVILIRGAAGTGKTTLTKALLAGVDVPYVVLAPSAEASRGVLRRENVDPNADTLAKFLIDEDMQARVKNGLIVLDEASLAGAHDLARLVQAADSLGARLLLLGDRRQHKSVARGDVLALLEDKAGLPVATVGEIRRQTGEYKAAVKLASDGKVADAFQKLDQLGWVKEGHDALVADYLAGLKDGKSQLVVAPTHAEGDAVTAKLRDALKKGGRWVRADGELKELPLLAGEEKRFQRLENMQLTEAERTDPETLKRLAGSTVQFVRHGMVKAGERVTITAENAEALAKQGARFVVYRPKELALAGGDTVRFTANDWDVTGKHRLNNGAVYQVGGFDGENVRLSNGWEVDARKALHLDHGYVSTSHGAQGRTTDRVLIAQSSTSFPASDASQFYVSVSRGRQQAVIYTDSKQELLEAIERDRPRMLAHDLIRQPKRNLVKRHKRAMAAIRELADKFRHKEPVKEQRPERGRDRTD